jgi:hypothetical protein
MWKRSIWKKNALDFETRIKISCKWARLEWLWMFLTSLYHIMCSDMRLPLCMYIVLVMHIYVHMFPNVFLMFNFIFYLCVYFFLELNVVFSCILSCTIFHQSHVCIFSFHVLMGTLKILNASLFIHFDNG